MMPKDFDDRAQTGRLHERSSAHISAPLSERGDVDVSSVRKSLSHDRTRKAQNSIQHAHETSRAAEGDRALFHQRAVDDPHEQMRTQHFIGEDNELPAQDTTSSSDAATFDEGRYKPSAGILLRERDTRETSDTSAAKRKGRLLFSKDDASKPGLPAVSQKATDAKKRTKKIASALRYEEAGPSTVRGAPAKKTVDAGMVRPKQRLVFEDEITTRRTDRQIPVGAEPIKATGNAILLKAHGKLHEVEHENIGVEAAHRGELLAEGGLRAARKHHRATSSRRTERLKRKTAQPFARTDFRRTLNKNPRSKDKPSLRTAQRRTAKRRWATAVRKSAGATKQAATAAGAGKKATGKVLGTISRHPAAVLIALLLALLLGVIVSSVSTCSNMTIGGLGTLTASSYLARDSDIDDAELAYTEWECDIQLEAQEAEVRYPGYDEYRYSVGDIAHSPYSLMAWLTVTYHDFSYGAIVSDLRAVFDQQYQLSFTPEVEIRTRTVVYADPLTGESTDVEEQYEWHILNITLAARSFTEVISPLLDTQQAQHFSLLQATKGSRQIIQGPFSWNWLSYVSSPYGYRIHPISGEKSYHTGVDIAVAQGTAISAATDGVVTTAQASGGYGLLVEIRSEGAGGAVIITRYAHCSELLVAAGQSVAAGDVIAKVGSTGDSTGPHLHFEVLKDGRYINPLYFAQTNDDGTGPIPPGSPGGISIPAYPGEPMDDERFAAMMTEAQRHLGKPYVFGASGPDSFDCSGFVCYVINHSGVGNVGRIGAQGLFNLSVPVSRTNARPGDLIFFTGTYDAGMPVTHIGIYIGNGQMIHAGSPVQYTSIDTPYWTQHFYAFGRI